MSWVIVLSILCGILAFVELFRSLTYFFKNIRLGSYDNKSRGLRILINTLILSLIPLILLWVVS